MVRTDPVVGAIAQVALLGGVAATVGLSAAGWAAGLACGAATCVLLAQGLARSDAGGLGPADRVTLVRAVLVGVVTALVVDSVHRPTAMRLLIGLVALSLALDAVDGWVARRTRTVSAFGATFDMEVDAFLILVLSASAARAVGPWALAIGAARYLFGAAGWVWPWMRGALPPRYWRKVVAATQGVVLAVVVAGVLPRYAAVALTAAALALLAESFGRDVLWLWRRREAQAPESTAAALAAGETADAAAGETAGSSRPAAPARRGRVRVVLACAKTVLALLLVWFALVAPNRPARLHLGAFIRIPVEGVALVGLVIALPQRARRVVALASGVLLGMLAIVKLLDFGFFTALDRPFNPVTDWGNVGPALGVLRDSLGRPGEIAVAVAAILLVLCVLALITLAVLRVASVSVKRRVAATRSVIAAALVCLACAALGQPAPDGAPVASADTASLAYDQVHEVRTGVSNQQAFADAVRSDPFGGLSGDKLLTGLRGKDVVIAFVESYGRVAVQDSPIAAADDSVLNAGSQTLQAAGYGVRSAFLTSPTFGGISWLAHSTLQSGLWIDNQQRYDQVVASNRFTLSDAFKRAGWHTVVDIPSNDTDWGPGRSFYHYDQILDMRNVGYKGPHFAYASMPDQYVYSAFQRLELSGPHSPVMAEIDLVSSHTPWAPLPTMVPWDQVGDGSIFDPQPAQGRTPQEVWKDPSQVKFAYAQSVQYTMSALVSFLKTFQDKNLVLVVLGDHQPATVVSGVGAGHDVPISIIADDPTVLDQISGWGWQPGLLPGPRAPVLRMDAFRDQFLDAYGPQSGATHH